MEYNELGNTGLKVSKLCFGALTIGPLQANLTVDEGARIIREAFDRGVNFIDTAELYETYYHINRALDLRIKNEIIIATKSYAYSRKMAEKSLNKAMKELDRDYIDIFLLHEQESEHTIKGHFEALEYFINMKEKGYIRAVGISTHTLAAAEAALDYEEIEVIHPIVNKKGLGIIDGTIDEMIQILKKAKKKNKGIYGMKPLGGGNLISTVDECFDFVLNLPFLDSIAVGIQSREEVIANVCRFNGEDIPKYIMEKLLRKNRRLHIESWCQKCGRCVEACKLKALRIKDDNLVVDSKKCVLCGYCSSYCPSFCIKIF